MKKTLLFLCAFLFPTLLLAQSRETKSRWGIELGMQNNVYYEHSLSDAFAIKTGVGYDVAFLFMKDKVGFNGLNPAIRISPRWYYGGDRSGYFALDLYGITHLGGFALPEVDKKLFLHAYGAMPAWGYNLRITDNFYFKSKIGVFIGAAHTAYSEMLKRDYLELSYGAMVDVGIGYRF
ncbi:MULTISPECIES: hypothetical protein [Porphyromonas]|uniref:Outer membrane protein beta-barrel domain-containing protein n=1 Tax=Porphyromonas canoris TaxID=36875 RepID=A0ABR4XJ43_9PORP|nr:MULTISPECIES: hypothetical protein [Porphyromonas]KGN67822.1 hypothetical protein JT26_07725 [Porphyromonas sp. COT-108 OH1349]KGN91718.1 hypothetical protein HQ43_06365 [Porphyromonas canoris]